MRTPQAVFHGLHEDSVKTPRGLREDSVKTLRGLREDSVKTLRGLREESPWTLYLMKTHYLINICVKKYVLRARIELATSRAH
jgi:hypothetical protein